MAASCHNGVRIQSSDPRVSGTGRAYSKAITIGRSDECEVQASAEMVSRIHGEVRFKDGEWVIEDLNSKNGIYCDGEVVENLSVRQSAKVRLGTDGPCLNIEVVQGRENPPDCREETQTDTIQSGDSRTSNAVVEERGGPSGSLTQYVQRYFEGEPNNPGEDTRMIREAYRRVRSRERRTYLGFLGGVIVLCILISGYALFQHLRHSRLRDEAERLWTRLKQQEVMMSKLQASVEASGGGTLEKQLAALEKQWDRREEEYRGYVEELGLHRHLTEKERQIYRVARLFGESEFSVPAGFVRKVKEVIQTHWRGPARRGFVRSIRRAERKGYTSFIVNTMQDHDLPPEFFYLALQESRFRTDAVGPRTRWGIAKGMWQFIPKTARKYGLKVGPRVDQRVVDPQDERHSFKTSTEAAADYLKRIYSTRAQASGLLVIASYNWGEHRVVDKMRELPGPQGIPEEAVEGIPENPKSRNYWQFLTEYEDRMPAETKDYVLKIFSAAVIGQNPKLFGFSFENPLRDPLEAPKRHRTKSTGSDSISGVSASDPSAR